MPTIFPFRELLAGDLRSLPIAELQERCGDPADRTDCVWVYRLEGQGGPDDPRKAAVQFLIEEGRAAHAHIHLDFADGLDYQEILW